MLPLIGATSRKRRIKRLIDQLEGYERAMRDICAQLIELSDEGDDLHIEVRRILECLDG
jgi:hypothetical protein